MRDVWLLLLALLVNVQSIGKKNRWVDDVMYAVPIRSNISLFANHTVCSLHLSLVFIVLLKRNFAQKLQCPRKPRKDRDKILLARMLLISLISWIQGMPREQVLQNIYFIIIWHRLTYNIKIISFNIQQEAAFSVYYYFNN